jgi:hypothetical protein
VFEVKPDRSIAAPDLRGESTDKYRCSSRNARLRLRVAGLTAGRRIR